MGLQGTTLAAAVGVNDVVISVTSAAGFAANQYIKIDEEWFKIANSYTSGTLIPVMGGQNGSVRQAHPISANVETDAISSTSPSDWSNPPAATTVAYGLAARRRKVVSYSASGAIALPVGGEDVVAILNGTSTLTMTLAVPTLDLDGSRLVIVGNGKSASTVAVGGNNGVGNAGSGYRTITFQNGGQVSIELMAVNGNWVGLDTPITGTSTAISVAIS